MTLNPESKARHQYEVETVIDGRIVWVYVNAHNRTQAAAIARRAGLEVRSMSMAG